MSHTSLSRSATVITVVRGNDVIFCNCTNERGESRDRLWVASWVGPNGIRRTSGRTPFTAMLRAARAARAEFTGVTA